MTHKISCITAGIRFLTRPFIENMSLQTEKTATKAVATTMIVGGTISGYEALNNVTSKEFGLLPSAVVLSFCTVGGMLLAPAVIAIKIKAAVNPIIGKSNTNNPLCTKQKTKSVDLNL